MNPLMHLLKDPDLLNEAISMMGETKVARHEMVAILKYSHAKSQAASQKALRRPLAASLHIYKEL